MTKILVNLGCGSRFHPDWLNFDVHPVSSSVIACNLIDGVPLSDASCDAVYSAALLEHLSPSQAESFIRECWRILKPEGILRMGVPDLEQIVRIYLEKLEAAVAGDSNSGSDYDWILLEMFDQMVRTRPGGDMLTALRRNMVRERFVMERIGDEFRQLQASMVAPTGVWARLCKMSQRKVRHLITRSFFEFPNSVRRRISMLLLSKRDADALRSGLFQHSGEVHRWMYDRYSLPRLLTRCGFRDATIQPYCLSRIDPNWPRFGLDTGEKQEPLKPDLFFVESLK